MRKIKFRAWCKTDKRMFKDVDVLRNGSIIYFEVNEYGEPIHWYDNYGESYEDEFANTMVVMQYTGLQDDNGQEIYEGDIVEYKERNLNKAFGYEEGPDYLEKTRTIEFKNQSFNVPSGFKKDLKIISNIYLEEEK